MLGQIGVQLAGVAVTVSWSALLTWVILKVCDAILGMRLTQEHETEGLDTALHDEKGYNL